MSRPLMQYGVGHLEEMFTKSKADPKVLKQLENELQHRQVPRAVALLIEVRAAIHSSTSVANPIVNPPSLAVTVTTVSEQHDIFENPPASSNVVVQKNAMVGMLPSSVVPTSPKQSMQEIVNISVDDAYKLLKVMPGSTWELIEQTRRSLVMQSHPTSVAALSADQRALAQTEAARINAAYLVLSTLR